MSKKKERKPGTSALLGLTQKQMALLLEVSRSQLSMYELGKRGLPLSARQLLAEIVEFLQSEDKDMRLLPYLIEQEEAHKKQVEQELRDNEDQLYLIDKKVAALATRYKSNLNIIGIVDYLNTRPNSKEKIDKELLGAFVVDAKASLQNSGLAELNALRRKQEQLELERILLSSALQKTVRTLEEMRDKQPSLDY